tara:strand:+ start:868 stop:1134 length:267 start_codon:yes stop_codon:yes gene_type:complete
MALPAIGAFVIKEGVNSLAWLGGLTVIEDYIIPYFTSDTEDIPLGDNVSNDQSLNNDLLEDIVKTNKALLQYHEVREDIYTPLNIDST